VWLIEISVAGRTITRRVPGRRRGLFGLDGRGLPWRATLLRPSTGERGPQRVAVGNGVTNGGVHDGINPDRADDATDAHRADRAEDRADAPDSDWADWTRYRTEWTADSAVAADAVGVEWIPDVGLGRRCRDDRTCCRYCRQQCRCEPGHHCSVSIASSERHPTATRRAPRGADMTDSWP
jgi:hypothetical protein